MIAFHQVGKRFGARWALVRFSLEVKPGELAWLEGPPGSGKSLAVRLALGEVHATAGSVEVAGANPAKLRGGSRTAWRRGIAAVCDDEAPLDLSAVEWTALGAWCAGWPWPASILRAREALERHALTFLASRPHADLSRGERLAVSLARALDRKPHVLLVDWAGWTSEPLPSSLEAGLRTFVTDGGTLLAAGSPGQAAQAWGGRRATMAAVED